MTENTDINLNTKSIRTLTLAVWILSALVCIDISLSLFKSLYYLDLKRSFQPSFSKAAPLPDPIIIEDPQKGFYEWPTEKQVQTASVIVIARYENENGKLKCMISEILKKSPGTTFYYKVGDEYPPGTRYLYKDSAYGEGQIIFFTDSPANMRFSCSFDGNRISGLGDMPLETLRKIIQKSTEPSN